MKISNLEATDMGSDQQEIADKVMCYVDGVDFENANEFDKQEGALIHRACEEMGWSSVPQVGGFIVDWEPDPEIPDLGDFMRDYECETFQAVIDLLEDGEALATLPLVQNQIEDVYAQARDALRGSKLSC